MAIYFRSRSGRNLYSLRKWLSGVSLHNGVCRSRLLRGGLGGRLSRFGLNDDAISSSNELIACDISSLREAKVRERSSVPYRCLTSFDKTGLIRRNQVRTTKFPRVGERFSSSVIYSLWWGMLQSDPRRLSSTNIMNLWNKSSGHSFGCNLIVSKSSQSGSQSAYK